MGGVVALGVLGATVVGGVLFLPPPPDGPRYLGAGHDSPVRGGTFVFHQVSDLPPIDPTVSYDEISTMAIKLLFEGLIDYDRETMELVPALAVEVPTPTDGGKTFVFRLRRGVRFQDSPVFEGGRGREVVAEDVRWTLERMLDPDVPSPGPPFFSALQGYEAYREGRSEHVAGIEVRDRYTIAFHLDVPDQTFLFAMATIFAYPVAREAYEHWGDEAGEHPVGTGAYRLESWDPGVMATFVRNPTYYRPGLPHVDRMVFHLNLDRDAAVMRFRNGEIDHIHRMTSADYLLLKRLEAWAPYRLDGQKVDVWGVILNCGMAPFDNRHLRRAVAFAIRRDNWRRAWNERLVVTGQPIPRALPGFDPDLPGRQVTDLDRAREEMRLAGFADGYPEPVDLWVAESDTSRLFGELVQADLARIGIDVRLRQAAFPVFIAQTGRPRTAPMTFLGWTMDYPDAANFLDVLFHSRSIQDENSKNRAFYANAEVDRLLDEARQETERATRLALYRRASTLIAEDAPWAFAFSNTSLEVVQPYVKGYRPHPAWQYFFRDIWLDLPRRRVAERVPFGRPAPRHPFASALGGPPWSR
ncbi:MAG: ABC transporter substrate-binding protein [Sandaracinaceae bacterium]